MGVTLRYPGAARPALSDVAFDIAAGALVVVTGPVGAGKTALARAVVGLWPLEAGEIWLDGCPAEAWPADQRAARLGYLPQDPQLFSGTVRENVLLGAHDGVVEAAISLAHMDADVRGFPDGLDTPIGERGLRVSGGQRQRIALARAIISAGGHGRGLLVLDDPFSAVDANTEAQMVAGLRAAFGREAPPEQRVTVVVCSHRLAICPFADRVIVLDAGRVTEQGTHVSLMAAGSGYARIYRAQHQAERRAAGTP